MMVGRVRSAWFLCALTCVLAHASALAYTLTDLPANNWFKITVSGTYPSFREWNEGVYNSALHSVMLFDGYADASHPYTIYSNSLWTYDFATNAYTLRTLSPYHGGTTPSDWYQVSTCNPPCQWVHPYDRHPYGGFINDTQDNVAILFGGVNAYSGIYEMDDTWAYSPVTNSWTNRNPTTHPSKRSEHAMVYVPTTNEVILFDGYCNTCPDLWSYKYPTNTWTRRDTPGQVLPKGRRTHSMIFLPDQGRVMLFGGKSYDEITLFNDTWLYDPVGNTWSNVSPLLSPAPRLAAGLAYDTRNKVVLMYGGYGANGPVNDTWIYHPDTNRWEALAPIATPGPIGRTAWRLAYDEANGEFLLSDSANVVWAFRYVPSGQALDSIKPSAIRDLRPR